MRGALVPAGLLLGLLARPAQAQDELEPRQLMHEAMIAEVVYGDLEGASLRYLQLIRNRAMTDDTRAQALVSLGRTLYDLGKLEAATRALVEARASGACDDPCRRLLQMLVIDQEAVTAMPRVWDFAEGDRGFFHPLDLQDQGSIKLEQLPDGTGVLRWESMPPPRRNDRLEVGLKRPSPAPREVAIDLSSLAVESGLLLWGEDETGHRYRLPAPVVLPLRERVEVVVRLEQLRAAENGQGPLDPARLTRLAFELVNPSGQLNVLYLYRVEIR